MVAVAPDANPLGPHSEDEAALARLAAELADAVEAALGPWVERVVRERWVEWRGEDPPGAVREAAAAAGRRARAEVAPRLRELLATDVDAQRTNPLAVIRTAVAHPTAVLAEAGMPPVVRDDQAERLFPEDHYDLAPATFGDLHESLHEPGLVWGAAKAHVVLRRRQNP